jgi:hypothetical protein
MAKETIRVLTLSTLHFYALFNFDISGAAFGLHALGGPYASPTM